MIDFHEFPKIPRLSRKCIITEKIDGTNARVHIRKCNPATLNALDDSTFEAPVDIIAGTNAEFLVRAGSKNRWLSPTKTGDNHGFAKWVWEHADELVGLGIGEHCGEWWGNGIQRGYGQTRKRFSLFNTGRWRPRDEVAVELVDWDAETGAFVDPEFGDAVTAPACCDVVPVIFEGPFQTTYVQMALNLLEEHGSFATGPGNVFKPAEGVVIFHTALNGYFKRTLLNDEAPKGKQ